MKIFFFLVVPIALIGVVYCVGLLLPVRCTATRTAILRASPNVVFELVTNNSKALQWRTDLKDVQILDNSGKEDRWVEYPKKGNPITFIWHIKEPYSLYEITMTDNKVFEGSWRGSFENHPDGTKVTFTESAIITNPFYRVYSFIFFDLGKTIDRFLTLLSNALDKR